MVELQSLRSRVEQVQVKLKAANAARTSESEALNKLWQQIRARYTTQEKELAELRSRSAELEDSRDELLGLVHHLLEATEGATEGISDSTVPEISRMAGELLVTGNQPKPDPVAMTDAQELHDKPTPAPQQAVAPPPPPAPKPAVTEPVPDTESLSPGIRTLIARVEGVFDEGEDKDATTDDEFGGADYDNPYDNPAPGGSAYDEADDDDLSRDLREIEKLRNDLQGLRRRISTSND